MMHPIGGGKAKYKLSDARGNGPLACASPNVFPRSRLCSFPSPHSFSTLARPSLPDTFFIRLRLCPISKRPPNFQRGGPTGLITGRLIAVLVLVQHAEQTRPPPLSTEEKQRTFRPALVTRFSPRGGRRMPVSLCSAAPLGTFLALVCQWFFPEARQAVARTGMGRELQMPGLWTARGGPGRPWSFFSQPLRPYISCSFRPHSF